MPNRIDSLIAKRTRHRRHAGAGKLQSIEAEDDFRGRLDADLGRGHECRECAQSRRRSARRAAFGIDRPGQPGDDVAAVGDVDRLARLGALVQFVDLPLGGLGVQIGGALAHNLRAPGRQEQLQPFHLRAPGKLLALVVHPENAEGEGGIDRRLSLFRS